MINSIVFKDNTIASSVHSYTIGTDMRHIVHSSLYRWHNTSLAKIYKHFSHIINFNIIICTYQNCKTLNARCDHNFWPAVCVYKILNAHKNKNKNKIAFQKILKTTRWNSSYYDAELLYVYRYPYDERASYHKRTIIVRTKNFFFRSPHPKQKQPQSNSNQFAIAHPYEEKSNFLLYRFFFT